MTRKDHKSGTDRIEKLSKKLVRLDVIVNVQGDEPL